MKPNFPYYNTVDQIIHAEWSIPQLTRQQVLRNSIDMLWPNGHPTKLIHVAGTGGKGSTCRFLEVGLMSIGRAGAYMSPHMYDYRERFSINGKFVEQDDLTEAWETVVKPHCIQLAAAGADNLHTFLEVSILLALTLFAKHDVEWAAIETHVGGRYDWTRGLDAVASLLTNVGSDHAHMLGSEPWQRVIDKAGIARRGVPFFTTETNPESLTIIESICEQEGAPLVKVGSDEVTAFNDALASNDLLPLADGVLLDASYQRWNGALAYHTLCHLYPKGDNNELIRRMAKTSLLGRFWQVEEGVYADVAHNVEKLTALADEIELKFGNVGKILVLGASLNRVPQDLFATLASVAKSIIITGATFKGQDPTAIYDEIAPLLPDTHMLVIADPQQALQTAKTLQLGDDIILLTGSTYMIEQALNPDPYLRHINSTFGWRMQTQSKAQGTVQLSLPLTSPGVR